jgi:hypothetical protein
MQKPDRAVRQLRLYRQPKIANFKRFSLLGNPPRL